jgi:hypothetical protein
MMRNGILLMNIISTASTTCWYHSRMLGGMPLIPLEMGTLLYLVVLPFRAPRFGPKICSAAVMSVQPMGQLAMSLESAILV